MGWGPGRAEGAPARGGITWRGAGTGRGAVNEEAHYAFQRALVNVSVARVLTWTL